MAELQADSRTLIFSKEVYESELHWGRLVIPGRYLPHFRRLQACLETKVDYHLWVQQEGTNALGYQIGVKMSIQRPMLTELHTLYRYNQVKPGDTLLITQDSAGHLVMSISKGPERLQLAADGSGPLGLSQGHERQQRASSRRGSGSNASSRSSSMDLGDLDSSPSFSRQGSGGVVGLAAGRPRRALHGGSSPQRKRWQQGHDFADEEGGIGNEEDDQLEMYQTGSGRWCTRLVRQGSESLGGTSSLRSRSGSGQLAAIEAQSIGYSDDLEVDGAAEVAPPADMQRFDALVNVAVGCLW